MTTVYVGRAPAYTKERNNRYLLIWDDIPNWVVVDKEAYQFIMGITGEKSVSEIAAIFKSIKEDASVDAVIDSLVKARVLYPKGEEPPRFLPGPDKIMSVCVYPTNRCNLQCIMCSRSDIPHFARKTELTAEEIINGLDQVRPFVATEARTVLSGGEPLLVPEKTLEIMEYASSFGQVSLLTNGTLITKEFAQKVAALEKVSVQVSLDSPFKESHESIRGKGTFDKTMNGIKMLVKEGVTTLINMVVHTQNIDHLSQYYELALQLKVSNARFIPLQVAGKGGTCGLKPPSLPALMEKSFAMVKKNPQYKKVMGTDFLSTTARLCQTCAVQQFCGTATRRVLIDSNGDVYPCPNHHLPEFKAGNITKERFSQIWKDAPVLQKIRETYPVESINEQCAHCYVRHWCAGWCRGETYHATGSMIVPSVKCHDVKKALVDMFFRLADDPLGGAKDMGPVDLNQI